MPGIPRSPGGAAGQAQPASSFEVRGVQRQDLQSLLAQLLKALPPGIALFGSDHATPVLDGEGGGRLSVHPGRDLPGAIPDLPQKAIRHGRAWFVNQSGDQEGGIEIERP